MILKNISGSNVAFKSISFPSILTTWPRKVYAYVIFGTDVFNLPGNLKKIIRIILESMEIKTKWNLLEAIIYLVANFDCTVSLKQMVQH